MRMQARTRLDSLHRQDRYRRRATPAAPFVLLGVSLALAVGLGILHNRLKADRQPDPVLAGVQSVLYPGQKAAAGLENGVSRLWSALFGGWRLARENDALRREITRLKLENQAMAADAADAVRLREALGFVQKIGRPLLAAQVIAFQPSPLFETLLVDRGTRDGVKTGTVARTPDGLLGQVSEASAFSAQVMLLSDTNSGVGAMVVRKGAMKSVGIVQGNGRDRPLELVHLRREDDVKPGDQVVTSGLGGIYPPHIPIGKIVSVAEDPARFLRRARLEPAARPSHVREVFLIR